MNQVPYPPRPPHLTPRGCGHPIPQGLRKGQQVSGGWEKRQLRQEQEGCEVEIAYESILSCCKKMFASKLFF